MATNISQIASLFRTPQEIMEEERKKQEAARARRMQMYAQAGQGLGPFQAAVQAWSQLGEIPIAYMEKQAMEDNPMYNKAIDLEYLLASYGEQDLTDPEVQKSLIKNLQSRGHTKEALTLIGQMQDQARGTNEAVTAFTGMVDGKRVPLTYDKNSGAYKYRKEGKLVDYDGDIEYKPSSLDPVKEEIAARLRNQRKPNGTAAAQPAAGTVQMGKDGRPTGKLNPANLPPPAAGGVTPQQALSQAEANRLKQQAILEAEKKRILEELSTQGMNIAP